MRAQGRHGDSGYPLGLGASPTTAGANRSGTTCETSSLSSSNGGPMEPEWVDDTSAVLVEFAPGRGAHPTHQVARPPPLSHVVRATLASSGVAIVDQWLQAALWGVELR